MECDTFIDKGEERLVTGGLTARDSGVVNLSYVSDGIWKVDLAGIGETNLVYTASDGTEYKWVVNSSYRIDIEEVTAGKLYKVTLPEEFPDNEWLEFTAEMNSPRRGSWPGLSV